jgi:hypothetical protein
MDLLDKRTDAQTLIVEQCPLIAILLWYAVSRQLQPGKADISGRHQNHSAAISNLV